MFVFPKREFICLKFAQNFNWFNSNDPSWGRQFDSILSLEFGIILHLLRVWLVRRACTVLFQIFVLYRWVHDISSFCFFNRCVSLKEREFTYSKFQQFLNSTTHQILGLGGNDKLQTVLWSVRPSYIGWIQRADPLGPRRECIESNLYGYRSIHYKLIRRKYRYLYC
jgi:hypothetical protein